MPNNPAPETMWADPADWPTIHDAAKRYPAYTPTGRMVTVVAVHKSHDLCRVMLEDGTLKAMDRRTLATVRPAHDHPPR